MLRVMVVDDEDEIRRTLVKFLEHEGHYVIEAANGREALEKLEEKDVDIVLMDIFMPELDGLAATKAIRERNYPVMVIIFTAYGDSKSMEEAAEAGADDFLAKPVDFQMLSVRLKLAECQLPFFKARDAFTTQILANMRASTETLKRLTQENQNLSMELIEMIYKISEYRDDETHEHTMRVGWLSGRIAEELGLDSEEATTLQFAAPLHDLGKVGIPDSILLKPAKLSDEEFEIMKTHTLIGHEILKGSSSSILKRAAEIALTHHERWDGSGYPKGLKKEEIPISGATTAVADSFDAIVSKRPYKKARPLDEAFDELERLAGKWYHPDVVNALLDMKDEIRDFYDHRDEKHHPPIKMVS